MSRKILIILVILAFAIRIICVFTFANITNPEMWEFGKIARNLVAGNGFRYIANSIDVSSAYMPPGLPFIYFVFFKLFGDIGITYVYILLFNAFLASMNVIIIYKIAQLIYDSKIGIISAGYAAISPIFIISTINYNSIIIYQVLIGLTFLLFLKYQSAGLVFNKVFRSDRLKYLLFLSLTLGLFIYFRSETLGFIAILCIYLISKKRMIDSLILLFVSVLIISPWTIRNYLTFGKIIPVSTSVGYNFYLGHSDDIAADIYKNQVSLLKEDSTYETEKSRIGFEEAFQFIKEHPADDIKESFSKVISLWFIDKYRESAKSPVYILTWITTLILFFTGYIKSLKDKNMRSKLFFMGSYLVFSTILVLVFFNIPRYQIQMSFIMVPTAMFGLYNIYIYFLKTSNTK